MLGRFSGLIRRNGHIGIQAAGMSDIRPVLGFRREQK